MTTNFDKIRDWMEIAIADANTALNNYQNENHYASFFFSQQCNEKLCKSLLLLFGKQVQKTHFPTQILQNLISNKDISDPVVVNLIQKLINQTVYLEREREIPCYGIEENERIMKPQDLYSDTDALKALHTTVENFELIHRLLGHLSKEPDFSAIIKKFLTFIEKVREL
ncbi:MAG: HEPN domain-containing protein [Candidatus Helarchaeota archaeon]